MQAPLFRASLILLATALFVGPLGCAGGKDAADRQLDRMRTDLARLESDQDKLSSRLTAIEVSGKGPTAGRTETTPALSPASGERPALRVVVLKPGEEPESTEPTTTDDGVASQTVRAQRQDDDDDRGSRLSGKKGEKDRKKKGKAAGKEYEDAYALVKAKDYEHAIPALTGFLVRFPDHEHADAAMFWIGASHAAKGELPEAAEILEGVLARFPTGNKAPDALLELSRIYKKQGEAARSEQAVVRLRRDFPRSDAAQRAPKSGS